MVKTLFSSSNFDELAFKKKIRVHTYRFLAKNLAFKYPPSWVIA